MSGRIEISQLSMSQVKADLLTVAAGIKESQEASPRLAKPLKGLVGFHLQQAAEKMIKIQIYASGKKVDNYKIYKHSLKELVDYGTSIGIVFDIPKYIMKNMNIITKWEAAGRYDLSLVIRLDTLKKCADEMNAWYESMARKYR